MKINRLLIPCGIVMLLTGCSEEMLLNKKDIINFSVSEEIAKEELTVRVSGLCGHSAYGISEIREHQKGNDIIIDISLKPQLRGDFITNIPVAQDVSRILLGEDVIWTRKNK